MLPKGAYSIERSTCKTVRQSVWFCLEYSSDKLEEVGEGNCHWIHSFCLTFYYGNESFDQRCQKRDLRTKDRVKCISPIQPRIHG